MGKHCAPRSRASQRRDVRTSSWLYDTNHPLISWQISCYHMLTCAGDINGSIDYRYCLKCWPSALQEVGCRTIHFNASTCPTEAMRPIVCGIRTIQFLSDLFAAWKPIGQPIANSVRLNNSRTTKMGENFHPITNMNEGSEGVTLFSLQQASASGRFWLTATVG